MSWRGLGSSIASTDDCCGSSLFLANSDTARLKLNAEPRDPLLGVNVLPGTGLSSTSWLNSGEICVWNACCWAIWC